MNLSGMQIGEESTMHSRTVPEFPCTFESGERGHFPEGNATRPHGSWVAQFWNRSNGRRTALVAILALSFAMPRAGAEKSVTTDNVDRWTRPQVEAALRLVLRKEGCQSEPEKVYKGSGILELKCSLGEGKVTVQVSSEFFSGADMHGNTLEKSFTSVWIKTTGGNRTWSKVIDEEMTETLRESDKAASQH
jgi:hypothetical protein